MRSDGSLLGLDKRECDELISTPLIKTVHPNIAGSMMENGYEIIDVRYSEEFIEHHTPVAILVPLYELRNRLDEFDPSKKYIAYCHGVAPSRWSR